MARIKLKTTDIVTWTAILLMSTVQASMWNFDAPNLKTPELGASCPEGTIFCFSTRKCLPSEPAKVEEKPCPISPVCPKNYVLKWTDGYAQCEHYHTACGGRYNVCMKDDGALYCDYGHQCTYYEVSITVNQQYLDFTGQRYEEVKQSILDTLSQYIPSKNIFLLEIIDLSSSTYQRRKRSADYGFGTQVIFHVLTNSPDSQDIGKNLESLIGHQKLTLKNADGEFVAINWHQSWWKLEDGSDDGSYDGGERCNENQMFCFSSMKCIDKEQPKKTCPAPQECSINEVLQDDKCMHYGAVCGERSNVCKKADGALYCDYEHQCTYYEVLIIVNQQYEVFVGQNYEEAIQRIMATLTLYIPMNWIFLLEIKDLGTSTSQRRKRSADNSSGTQVSFHVLTNTQDSQDLGRILGSLIDQQQLTLKNADGEFAAMNWDQSWWKLEDGSDDGSYDGGEKCNENQMFCFSSMKCIDKEQTKKTCPAPQECSINEVLQDDKCMHYGAVCGERGNVCKKADGALYCDYDHQCTYYEVLIIVNQPYEVFVGQNYEEAVQRIMGTLSQSIPRHMIFLLEIIDRSISTSQRRKRSDDSSVVELWFNVQVEVENQDIENILKYLIDNQHLTLKNADGEFVTIDWYQSWWELVDGSDDGLYDRGEKCNENQMFCFSSWKCINKEAAKEPCAESPKCWINENEVLTMEDGQEKCLHYGIACGMRESVCKDDIGEKLYCGTGCSYVQVELTISHVNADIDGSLVGAQIIAEMGIDPESTWLFEFFLSNDRKRKRRNDDTYHYKSMMIFNVPVIYLSDIEFLFYSEVQLSAEGWAIDWTASSFELYPIQDDNDEGTMCASDQMFCFSSWKCINKETTKEPCSESLKCSMNENEVLTMENGQEKCLHYGIACGMRESVCKDDIGEKLYCGTGCSYVQVELTISHVNADIDGSLVGAQIIAEMGIDPESTWLFEFFLSNDRKRKRRNDDTYHYKSVMIFNVPVINLSDIEFLFYSEVQPSAEGWAIDWTASSFELYPIQDDVDSDDEGEMCASNQMFCFSSWKCINKEPTSEPCTEAPECSEDMVWCDEFKTCLLEDECDSSSIAYSTQFLLSIHFNFDGVDYQSIIEAKDMLLAPLQATVSDDFETDVTLSDIHILPRASSTDQQSSSEVTAYVRLSSSAEVEVAGVLEQFQGRDFSEFEDNISSFVDIGVDSASIIPIESNNNFLLNEIVPDDTEVTFTVDQLVGDVANMPDVINLNCSGTEGVSLKSGNQGFASSISFNKGDEVVIRQSIPESKFVVCQIGIEEEDNTVVLKSVQPTGGSENNFVFLALHGSISESSDINEIRLENDWMEVYEDSGLTSLPGAMFSSSSPGASTLLEFIRDSELSIMDDDDPLFACVPALVLLEDTAFSFFKAEDASRKSLRATIGSDVDGNGMPLATFSYRGIPVYAATELPVIAYSSEVAFSLKDDFYGSTHFTINMVGRQESFVFGVNVMNLPDLPELITSDLSEGVSSFAVYPDEQTELTVGSIMDQVYADRDGTELDMILIGAGPDKYGTFEYKNVEDNAWTPVESVVYEDDDEYVTAPAVQLSSEAWLRFNPGADDNNPWSINSGQAPHLVFLAFDKTDDLENTSPQSITEVSMELSFALGTGMDRYWSVSPSTLSRKLAVLPLLAYGCDGVLNSGRRQLSCGCNDDTSCFDCLGVKDGDNEYNECGVCSATSSEIDCDDPECAANRQSFCEQKKKDEEAIDTFCEEGLLLNSYYGQCGNRCITGIEVLKDRCGDYCGTEKCVDCMDIVDGGHTLNPCDECVAMGQQSDTCNIGLGIIDAPYALPSETGQTLVDIQADLVSDETTFYCSFKSVDSQSVYAPAITETTYVGPNDDGSETGKLRLAYEIESGQEELSIGSYYIECSIEDPTSTILLSTEDSGKTFSIHSGYPSSLTSVEPPSYEPDQELSSVLVSGTGFIDSGVVRCLVSCDQVKRECSGYYQVSGIWLNEEEVKCPVSGLIGLNQGREYHISVVFFGTDHTIDPSRLSSVQFTVKVAAPRPVSAVLDGSGCNMMIITFDKPFVIEADDITKCSDFMTNVDENAKCESYREGDLRLLVSGSGFSEGTVFSFKDSKIRSDDDYLDPPAYLNAGETVIVTSDDIETPIVTLGNTPGTVGCQGTIFQLDIKNKGCWPVLTDWSISADSQADTSGIITDSSLRTQLITPSQLESGVKYTITVSYTVGPESGSIWREFETDPAPTVRISGVYNGTDAAKEHILSVDSCRSSSTIIEWQIVSSTSSSEVWSAQGSNVLIAADSLAAGKTYVVRCTVTTGASSATETVTFTTAPAVINPAIFVDNSDEQKQHSTQNYGDGNFVLSSGDTNSNSGDEYTYTWTCETNKYGANETHMRPCVYIDENDEQMKRWEATGSSVTISKEPHKTSDDYDISFIYTVRMMKGTEESSASIVILYKSYTSLEKPEFRIKSSLAQKIPKNGKVKIKVLCRKTTHYTWGAQSAGSEEQYNSINVSRYIKSGTLNGTINYNEQKYKRCSIKLDLRNAVMVPDSTYALSLTAYNTNESASSVQIFTVHTPAEIIPGKIEVHRQESFYHAIVLSGWQDGLECFVEYRSTIERIDTFTSTFLSNSAMSDIFLPGSGEYVFIATCEDTTTFMSATATLTLEVQESEQPDIFDIVENDVQAITESVQVSSLATLTVISTEINALDTSVHASGKIENVQSILVVSVGIVIEAIIDFFPTTGDWFLTYRPIIILAKLQITVPDSTNLKLLKNGAKLANAAVQDGGVTGRRKRSTGATSTDPIGLTINQTTLLLEGSDLSVVNYTLTQEKAESFISTVDDSMTGMCIRYDGDSPWVAEADFSYIKVFMTDISPYGNAYNVVSDQVDSKTLPAEISLGNEVIDNFGGEWECTSYVNCTVSCLTTALYAVDPYTPTSTEYVAENLTSNIFVARILNPETNAEESVWVENPIEVTLVLNETVHLDTHEYKCFMWIGDKWSKTICNASIPVLDEGTNEYKVVCMCPTLGVIGVFKEALLQLDPTTTTTTTITTTTTTSRPSLYIPDSAEKVFITFDFNEDYNTNVITKSTFLDHLLQWLMSTTTYPAGCFQNLGVSPGSIVVTFNLNTGSGLTLGEMVYAIQNLLTTGGLTYTSENGATLTIDPSSFTYKVDTDDDEDSDDSDDDSTNVGIIVGGVIAGVVIIALIAVIVVLVLKQKGILKFGKIGSTASIPKDPPPSYEIPRDTFVMPAPPPYLYDDPMAGTYNNGWIENEVERKVALISEEDAISRPRSGCKSADLRSRETQGGLPSVTG